MADQNASEPEDVGAPIAYLVLARGTAVYDRSGDRVGTVEHVLADDREDIFHGLVVKTDDGHRYAPADQVDGIFERAVIVAKPAGELPEPSADPAAEAVADEGLGEQLKRAWDWIIQPH
jgi:hypothetical protein